MSASLRLAEALARQHNLEDRELLCLLEEKNPEVWEFLRGKAQEQCREVYGNRVFIRGLIEFTNFAKTTAITAAFEKATARSSATG